MRKLPVVVVVLAVLLVGLTSPAGALPPGAIDPGYGSGGVVDVNLTTLIGACQADPANPECTYNREAPYALLGRPDGSVVVLTVFPRNCCESQIMAFRLTPDGRFDRSFGTNGITLIGPPRGLGTLVGEMAADGAGRIIVKWTPQDVVGVPSSSVIYTRLLPNGRLDTTFGVRGNLPLHDGPFVVAPDGSIYAGTGSSVANGFVRATIAKIAPDGRIDPTYGIGGTGTLVTRALTPDVRQVSGAYALARQADGAVVAVLDANVFSGQRRLVIGRLLPSGWPDPTVGPGGVAVPARDPAAPGFVDLTVTELVALPDGHLLAAGPGTYPDDDSRIIRIDPRGRPDLAFGTGGEARIGISPPQGADGFSWMDVDGAGRILVVDQANGGTSHGQVVEVGRFTADGHLDPSYGVGGLSPVPAAIADAPYTPIASTLAGDGRVVLGTSIDNPLRTCQTSAGPIPCADIVLIALRGG